jgi:hypothetical protein
MKYATEDSGLVTCDAASPDKWLPPFQRTVVPSSHQWMKVMAPRSLKLLETAHPNTHHHISEYLNPARTSNLAQTWDAHSSQLWCDTLDTADHSQCLCQSTILLRYIPNYHCLWMFLCWIHKAYLPELCIQQKRHKHKSSHISCQCY